MITYFCVIVIGFILVSRVSCRVYSFPDDFIFGAGSSAAQVEGAYNEDGKSWSIWDTYAHQNPSPIADKTTADVACDEYHKYKEDVQLLKDLGVDAYRFSLSWSRILPNGFANVINELGIQYYINLINELIANGITPIVTLYHWDHPQNVEDLGGWLNPIMKTLFLNYARVVFDRMGHLLPIIATVNEPITFCTFSYGNDSVNFAPGKRLGNYGPYLCVHHMLLAHAMVYHMYDKEYRHTYKGQIGLSIDFENFIPADPNNPSDVEAALTGIEFRGGWAAGPIWHGDYPKVMKEKVAEVSEAEGFSQSRLPNFSHKEKKLVKGATDFLGMNYYFTSFASEADVSPGTAFQDSGILKKFANTEKVITGFRQMLNHIKKMYDNPMILVTETGVADSGELEDSARISYFHEILKVISKAIYDDRVNVIGFCWWSMMDNFEWSRGYESKYGVYKVNFTSPERERTPKASAKFFQKMLTTRQIPETLDDF